MRDFVVGFSLLCLSALVFLGACTLGGYLLWWVVSRFYSGLIHILGGI